VQNLASHLPMQQCHRKAALLLIASSLLATSTAAFAQPGKAPSKAPSKASASSKNDGGGSLAPNAKASDAAVLDHVRLLNSNSALADRADMPSLHDYLVTTIATITKYFNNSKRGRPMGLSVQCNLAPGNLVLYELQVRPVERQDAKMGVELTNALEKIKAPAVSGPVGIQILMKVFYPKPEVTALVKKGLELQKADKNKEAAALYTQALAIDSGDLETYICRGVAYNSLGKYEEAVADFSKAISLGGNEGYLSRSAAYRQLKKLDEAMADCNKAIELEPNYWEGYVRRAQLNFDKGKYAEAVADCDKVVGFMSTCGSAYLVRGEAHEQLKEHEEAVRDLTMAVEILGKSGEAYYYRALAYKALGKTDEAAADSANATKLGYQHQ
jgi:tetratricopeptide (TPR) repeat protein